MNLTDLQVPFRAVSEREPGTWTECTFVSGVMAVRAWGIKVPAQLDEAKALHRASGDQVGTGSNIDDLIAGIRHRYDSGKGVKRANSAFHKNIWRNMPVGVSGVYQGSMGVFPDGHHLRRWDAGFRGFHAIFAIRLDNEERVWWVDPLAPKGDYNGEWVPLRNFQKFVEGLSGGYALMRQSMVKQPAPAPTLPPDPEEPIVLPVVPTFTQAQLDAEVAASYADGLAAGTSSEQQRIRDILGL